MIITVLKSDGFKNLDRVLIRPHPKFNLITGMNAQGKTNLLESIWLMTGCKSFRGTREKDFLGFDRDYLAMGMRFEDTRRTQTITYYTAKENPKVSGLLVNGVKTTEKKNFLKCLRRLYSPLTT